MSSCKLLRLMRTCNGDIIHEFSKWCLAALLLVPALALSPARGAESPEYEVWVFKWGNCGWVKQDDRTLRTPSYAQGKEYLASVNAVDGWKATSNLPGFDPLDGESLLANGRRLLAQDELDQAIAECDKAIRLSPTLASAFVLRGLAWEAKGDYSKASADYEKACVIAPSDADALKALAWFLATCPIDDQRDGKRAVEIAIKACECGDWQVDQCETLAAAYASQGDFDKAVTWQKEVVGRLRAEGKSDLAANDRLTLFNQRVPYRALPALNAGSLQMPTFRATYLDIDE